MPWSGSLASHPSALSIATCSCSHHYLFLKKENGKGRRKMWKLFAFVMEAYLRVDTQVASEWAPSDQICSRNSSESYLRLGSWLATPGYWISPGCTGSRGLGCWLLGSPGSLRQQENWESWRAGKACWASGWSTSGSHQAHSNSSWGRGHSVITEIFVTRGRTSTLLTWLGASESLLFSSTHPLPFTFHCQR